MGKRSRLLETLPHFLLFFLFTCCMFAVLISGAKLYKNVSAVLEEQFSANTCISYITAKVRHYDTADAVSIGKIGEEDAILLKEEIDGEAYLTYLYCTEGSLMELFCSADMEVFPSDGQMIMPLDTFHVTMENDLLSVSCTAEGEQKTTSVYLQSGKGDSE
ncbi:DUF4860 domain-containing protein [Anaerotignum sp.]